MVGGKTAGCLKFGFKIVTPAFAPTTTAIVSFTPYCDGGNRPKAYIIGAKAIRRVATAIDARRLS